MRRNGVYPHDYMDGWEKFDKTSLPLKDAFYSKPNRRVSVIRSMNMHKKLE